MKNLKVFVGVKKFGRFFYTRKCALPLFSCLFTQEREIEFYVAFEDICVFYSCDHVMGRAGLGLPNRYVQ